MDSTRLKTRAKQLSKSEVAGRSGVEQQQLRPVDALRFLSLVSCGAFDDQERRREYFSRYNVDKLLSEVRKRHSRTLS
jgi:hypothetical protein